MKKIIPIIIAILILAFPSTIENIINKVGEYFMMIITPALEFIANLIR